MEEIYENEITDFESLMHGLKIKNYKYKFCMYGKEYGTDKLDEFIKNKTPVRIIYSNHHESSYESGIIIGYNKQLIYFLDYLDCLNFMRMDTDHEIVLIKDFSEHIQKTKYDNNFLSNKIFNNKNMLKDIPADLNLQIKNLSGLSYFDDEYLRQFNLNYIDLFNFLKNNQFIVEIMCGIYEPILLCKILKVNQTSLFVKILDIDNIFISDYVQINYFSIDYFSIKLSKNEILKKIFDMSKYPTKSINDVLKIILPDCKFEKKFAKTSNGSDSILFKSYFYLFNKSRVVDISLEYVEKLIFLSEHIESEQQSFSKGSIKSFLELMKNDNTSINSQKEMLNWLIEDMTNEGDRSDALNNFDNLLSQTELIDNKGEKIVTLYKYIDDLYNNYSSNVEFTLSDIYVGDKCECSNIKIINNLENFLVVKEFVSDNGYHIFNKKHVSKIEPVYLSKLKKIKLEQYITPYFIESIDNNNMYEHLIGKIVYITINNKFFKFLINEFNKDFIAGNIIVNDYYFLPNRFEYLLEDITSINFNTEELIVFENEYNTFIKDAKLSDYLTKYYERITEVSNYNANEYNLKNWYIWNFFSNDCGDYSEIEFDIKCCSNLSANLKIRFNFGYNKVCCSYDTQIEYHENDLLKSKVSQFF